MKLLCSLQSKPKTISELEVTLDKTVDNFLQVQLKSCPDF